MKIVTTTCVFPRRYPAEKAIERLAAVGFEGLDMGLDYWNYGQDSPFMRDGYLDWAKKLRKLSDELGVPYTHAHSPSEAGHDPMIGRAIETAAALGAGYMVVHPVCERADGSDIDDPEEFIKVNAEAIEPWLGTAGEYGVVLLSENLLTGASTDPRVISRLVSAVGSDAFGWCFDTGHANCFGYGPEVLFECENVPLSLHIQDNDGEGDDHLIPGDGNIDWDKFAQVIVKIGYKGDCVLEAHHQSVEAPDNERETVLGRLLEAAKELCSKISH